MTISLSLRSLRLNLSLTLTNLQYKRFLKLKIKKKTFEQATYWITQRSVICKNKKKKKK